MDYSSIANLPNLQPGSTGPDVKTLQTWLIQNGFNIPDGATGYYGPETKAAVASWQQQAGFNTQGNPGYFGPLSKSYIQSQTTAPKTTSTPPATPTAPSPTTSTSTQPQGIPYDPSWAKYGVTQDIWNSMNATQRGVAAAALQAGSSLYASTGNKVTLEQALATAASDPNIVSQFSDAAGIDKTQLQQMLKSLQVSTGTTAQQEQQQFENERKALAEQYASAGQAYSGFRGEAQKQLGQTESSVITSTRQSIQDKLDQATAAFEAKYGSTNIPSLSVNLPSMIPNVSLSGQYNPSVSGSEAITGQPSGGITGSQPIAKQQAINTDAAGLVSLSATPNVIPA